MKITKKQINKIRDLKEKGKIISEIVKIIKIPRSTVTYYFNDDYKEKQIERSKDYLNKNGDKRNKDNYREYQKNYHRDRYNNDKEYREKVKERNRINNKIYYQNKKNKAKSMNQ